MLEKMDLTKKLGKTEYKEKMNELMPKLSQLQRDCRQLEIPVMIVFDGFDAAGKGVQIGRLIQALDPRGFEVHAVEKETREERLRPFMWRFWNRMPEKGRIAVYDSSWYRKVITDRFDKKISKSKLAEAYESICSFEKQLTDDNILLIKFFLCIDKKEQKKRFEKLLSKQDTSWRVDKHDIKRNAQYERYEKLNEEMLQKTDTDYAPWHLIEAADESFATVKIYTAVINYLTEQMDRIKKERQTEESGSAEKIESKKLQESVLAKADLTSSYTREEYKKKLKNLQNRMEVLHGELYRNRIPVVLGFEGWDAGGKGGAIKRLTEKMDPRGYMVIPTAAPNDLERKHHYLWRFWTKMPKDGHVAVFDRTWYGRVMVERVEGFCTKKEWQRAYKEINDMERDLVNHGAIVLKFWLQIDKDEQERRFHARMENPEKQWKITEEDWRNRKKWDVYEEAVNEMLVKTSTPDAPWIVVEGNCKYYARIKVLETVISEIEKRLKKGNKKD